jgi:hypothetical protein
MYRGRVRIAPDGTVHAGAEAGSTLLAEQVVPGLTAPPGTALRLRVRVTGTNPTAIQVMVWRADAAEPGAWSVTASDSTAGLQQAGVVGVRAASTESLAGSVAFSFHDMDVVAPKEGAAPYRAAAAGRTSSATRRTWSRSARSSTWR